MKLNIILSVSLLSIVSLSAVEERCLQENLKPTGRIADVQERIAQLRHELGCARESDNAKKGNHATERAVSQQLFPLVLQKDLEQIKQRTARDIQRAQVVPYPAHVTKK